MPPGPTARPSRPSRRPSRQVLLAPSARRTTSHCAAKGSRASPISPKARARPPLCGTSFMPGPPLRPSRQRNCRSREGRGPAPVAVGAVSGLPHQKCCTQRWRARKGPRLRRQRKGRPGTVFGCDWGRRGVGRREGREQPADYQLQQRQKPRLFNNLGFWLRKSKVMRVGKPDRRQRSQSDWAAYAPCVRSWFQALRTILSRFVTPWSFLPSQLRRVPR